MSFSLTSVREPSSPTAMTLLSAASYTATPFYGTQCPDGVVAAAFEVTENGAKELRIDCNASSSSAAGGGGSCASSFTTGELPSPASTAYAESDDAQSLKSWFESSLQSATNFASRFTSYFPPAITGQRRDSKLEPLYDVFLGGSCGNTVWRREIVIPYLKKRSITYYDPQRPVWSENMIYEESIAKENSRLFLFVLDPGTINATSFLEIAYFAARKAPKLVVVFLGRREWSDKAHPMDLPDRIRTCNLLEAILKRHSVPMLTSINEALDYVDDMIIGEKSWPQAMRDPLQRVPYLQVKSRRAVHKTKSSLRGTFGYMRETLGTWAKASAGLVIAELLTVLALHFYLLPQLPLWLLVVPFLAFDYLAVAAAVVFCRYKARRRKHKLNRKVLIPTPPIPRCGSTAVTTSDRSRGSVASCEDMERMRLSATHKVQPPSTDPSSLTLRPLSYDTLPPLNLIDSEVRTHYKEELVKCPRVAKKSRQEKLMTNGCVTSPVGYDVFLSCSSGSELEWITQKAVPQLHKSGLTYTSSMMCEEGMRIPLLHTASHILYYIPSYRTFLSGMIEIAYFIGHSDWQVTVCVPREAECLILLDDTKYDEATIRAVERRNECYRMAFCYLKDMAARRQCRVFTNVEDSIKFIADQSRRESEQKKAVLRNVLEKQHLVKEKTQVNLLAHKTAIAEERQLQLQKQQSDASSSRS